LTCAAAVGGCSAAGRVGGDTWGMSGEVVGQAVNAVLAPPQAERFRGSPGWIRAGWC
jgi:hypothetical protein